MATRVAAEPRALAELLRHHIEALDLAVAVLDAPVGTVGRAMAYRALVGHCGTDLEANAILTPILVARATDTEGRTL